jgi:acetyl esterase/lipase
VWSYKPLKLKELIQDKYHYLGLKLINSLARSSRYRIEDIGYGGNHRHRYDRYSQVDGSEDRVKIIFLYGGGWQSGTRKDFRFVADTLCSLGFDVFVPDYRLYPEVRFGEILSDVVTAVDSIMDDNDGAFFVMGHSAGAQMGALLSLNTDLLRCPDRIVGFIGLAGPYDFYPYTEEAHWDLFAPKDTYPASQPVNFVREDAPPMLLLHGREDTRVRRGHSKSLMEKQQATGGTASREVYDNMGHVGIILSFTRMQRRKSKVLADLHQFVMQHKPKL